MITSKRKPVTRPPLVGITITSKGRSRVRYTQQGAHS